MQEALYEHRFWLQILGDHSRFILSTLSPEAKQDADTAAAFIPAFDRLLEQARRAASDAEAAAIAGPAYELTLSLRQFKLELLRRALQGKAKTMLTPSFLNHMVNELEEYWRILVELVAGRPVPVFDALHHDFLWLPDAAGHAAAIAADLDATEKPLIRKSEQFETHFQQLYAKSIEMAGFLRTELKDYPAFRRLHKEVDHELRLFVAFLRELEELELTAEVLDRIDPLMPDHMMREECYYLTKLAKLGLASDPGCDADRPRIET